MTREWPEWMHTAVAADYLIKVHGISLGKVMLTKLRWRGGGPVFFKDGALVVYQRSDLDDFAAVRRRGPFASGADVFAQSEKTAPEAAEAATAPSSPKYKTRKKVSDDGSTQKAA
jgi:hypothetical protein